MAKQNKNILRGGGILNSLKKGISTLLAILLAMTICVPAQVIAGSFVCPDNAWAATSTSKSGWTIDENGHCNVPAGTKEIPAYEFRNNYNLKSITLPSGLTTIGMYSFNNCSYLTSIEFPDTLTKIYTYAFAGCNRLSGELKLPNSVSYIDTYAFQNCVALSGNLELPNSLKQINDYSFDKCSKLTSVIIPEGVTIINREAFGSCTKLTSVKFPNTLTSIGSNAFFNCTGLTCELKLPDNLTNIGQSAFYSCTGLTGELKLPDNLTSIGKSAFWKCSKLTGELVIPAGITSIPDGVFGYTNISSIKFPETLTNIGEQAFYSCTGLTGELKLPDTLTTIDNYAFCYCSGLSGELKLPDTLTTINKYAFYNCDKLTKVIIPKSDISFGKASFVGCTGLVYYDQVKGLTPAQLNMLAINNGYGNNPQESGAAFPQLIAPPTVILNDLTESDTGLSSIEVGETPYTLDAIIDNTTDQDIEAELIIGKNKETQTIPANTTNENEPLTTSMANLKSGTYPVSLLLDGVVDIEGTVNVNQTNTTLQLITPSTASASTPSTVNESASTIDIDKDKTDPYKAIKLFSADITGDYLDNEAPTGSNIESIDPTLLKSILTNADNDMDMAAWFTANGYEASDDNLLNSQLQLEYIQANINHQPGVGLNRSEFGMKLAKALNNAGLDSFPTADVYADDIDLTELDGEGYYLIIRTENDGENIAATSPIFAAIHEGRNVIILKTALPSITKLIQEDSEQDNAENGNGWMTEADHMNGQAVNYKLIGTAAEDVDAYSTYKFTFVDEWDGDKMELIDDDDHKITITADGNKLTVPADCITLTEEADPDTDGKQTKLEITFDNLRELVPDLNSDTVVIVDYSLKQIGDYKNTDTAYRDGVMNTAYLEYSNNPIDPSFTKSTAPVYTKDYSYGLTIHKVDKNTGEDLKGVEFSIYNETDDTYLSVDEDDNITTSATPHAWTTDKNGMIEIYGIDADEYTVEEMKALDNYDDLNALITVYFDTTNRALVKSALTTDSDLVNADEDSTDIALTIANIKQIGLPSTGAMGLGILLVIALIIGIRATLKRRKEETATVHVLD